MNKIKQLMHKEWLMIALMWVLVFASAPLYMYYGAISIQEEFRWSELLNVWSYIVTFMAIFLLHHYVLMPLLLNKKKIWLYVLSVVTMLVLFVGYMRMRAPERPRFDNDRPAIEQEIEHRRHHHRHPILLAPPDMARLVIALLMLGADLGIVAWMSEQKMRQRLLLLEQQNLKQELAHLRYQINPHFFMNTLNNIHVLVDLDQERAKRAIVELSGMMRYGLYEGDRAVVKLEKEVAFLEQYISLMKLRYCDKVEVFCDFEQAKLSQAQILPLLLPTFVENAFKHGVSYQQHSFIHVTIKVDQEKRQVTFSCVNSQNQSANPKTDHHHGIGLENVRKRLDLHYGQNYSLHIDSDNPVQFAVMLEMPY